MSRSEDAVMGWAAHFWDVDRHVAKFPDVFESCLFQRWITACHLRQRDPPALAIRCGRPAMRVDRIATDDIVEVRIKGRTILGRVTEINDGIVYFRPICPGAGWRHAKALEIVAHWRKAGRRGGRAEDESEPVAPLRGQLSLPGGSQRAARARSSGAMPPRTS